MTTTADKFWRKVERRDLLSCWLWTGTRDGKGYGVFRNSGAHRVAYQLTHGPIPPGLFICHTCDVPLCCNPSHLIAGTPRDNLHDAMRKKRWTPFRRGERNGKAKLTEQQVIEIRSIGKRLPLRSLAILCGVGETAIDKVMRGQRWRHIA